MLLSGISSGSVLQQRHLPLHTCRRLPGPKTQREKSMVAAAQTEAPTRTLRVFQASELSHAQLKELTARPRIDFKTIGQTVSSTWCWCTRLMLPCLLVAQLCTCHKLCHIGARVAILFLALCRLRESLSRSASMEMPLSGI